MTEPTAEQPQVTATVSPPDPKRSRWSAIPHHLGRARTSTVVLALLFLAIGTLWVNVRPDAERRTTPASDTGVEEPVTTPTDVPTTPVPTETAPTTDAAPTPTEAPTTSSTDVPTSTETSTRFPTTTPPTTSEPPAPTPETTSTPVG